MNEFDDGYDRIVRYMNEAYSAGKEEKSDEKTRNKEIIDLIAKEIEHLKDAVWFNSSEIPVSVVKRIIKIWNKYDEVKNVSD
jgi:3-polyprenyl-4-hydroxybenzoate decarboxylase